MSLAEKLSQPIAGVLFPSSPVISAALSYVEAHSITGVLNHVIRSAYFALIIANKLPSLAHLSRTLLVLAALLHDLGWDSTGELISPDKRFEVDGANAARAFLTHNITHTGAHFNASDLQLVWDAIALHTTASIAQYKEPVVAGTNVGVDADFYGPNILGGGVLTPEEWRAVVEAFPLLDMHGTITGIFVGLCRTKPDTTYDNVVSEFGVKYLPGFSVAGKQPIDDVENALKGLEEFMDPEED